MQVEGVLCHRRLNYHQKYIRHISYQKKIHFSTTGKMNTRYFIQTVNLLGEEVASMFSSSTNAQYSPYSRVSFPFLFECSAALRLKNIIYLLAKILHFSVHQQKYIYMQKSFYIHQSHSHTEALLRSISSTYIKFKCQSVCYHSDIKVALKDSLIIYTLCKYMILCRKCRKQTTDIS